MPEVRTTRYVVCTRKPAPRVDHDRAVAEEMRGQADADRHRMVVSRLGRGRPHTSTTEGRGRVSALPTGSDKYTPAVGGSRSNSGADPQP